jgi:Ammonium Transporter Family
MDEGRLSQEDVECIKRYSIQEFQNPNTDIEEESSMWLSIGTMVLWLGRFFFNGGSAYTLYDSTVNPAKIIENTILSAGAGGGIVFFFKKPISLWYSKCFQK